jgi:hypothetical protein
MQQQIVTPVVVGDARSSEVHGVRVGGFAPKGVMKQMNSTAVSHFYGLKLIRNLSELFCGAGAWLRMPSF